MIRDMLAELQSLLLTSSYNLKSSLILIALLVILVLAYSVQLIVKGRAHYARVDKQGGSALLSKGLMEMGYWSLQPFARALIALGITPNMISWASLVVALLSGACLSFGHFGFGGAFAALAGFMDVLDGMVARLTGTTSGVGQVLDSSIDRYAEFFFIGGLIVHYRDIPVLQVLALFALMGSFMVSYSTAKAEALQIIPPRGSMRRSERMVYLTAGAILSPISIAEFEYVRDYPINIGFPMVFSLGLIAVLANASAIERLAAVAREMRKRDEEEELNRQRAAREALLKEEGHPSEVPTRPR
jgi:CDP-diacylglycerol--glycerol-3-phosphate 3-phosphatidyltransferase